MIITCQSCGTQFYIANQALATSGKNVKCSSCKAVWFQDYVVAPKVKLSKLSVGALDPKKIFLPAVIKRRSPLWGLVFAAGLFFMVLGAGFASFQTSFIDKYFNASKLYDKLSGPSRNAVTVRSIEIAHKADNRIDINGTMENKSGGSKMVPPIRLLLFDENKKLLSSIVMPAPPKSLKAGGKYSFYRKLEGNFKTKPKMITATFATRAEVLLYSLGSK